MLKKLTIRNFQAHRKLVVEFGPGVTSLTGPSDVGKSAVLRALRWVLLNRPAGEAFLREGADTVKASLEIDDHTISRTRGAAGNLYHADGLRLVAFGAEVPAEIAGIANIGDINVQGQHDAPFWFAETPGTISRALNEIVDLGNIDTTLARLGGWLRETNAAASVCRDRLASAKADRQRLAGAVEADAALRAVETLQAECVAVARRTTALEGCVAEAERLAETAQRAARTTQRAGLAVALGVVWAETAERRKQLGSLVGEITKQYDLANRPIPDLRRLIALHADWVSVATERQKLEVICGNANEVDVQWTAAVAAASRLRAKLEKALKGACPLCGRKAATLSQS